MEEDAIQIEKNNEEFQRSGDHESQDLVVPSHSPAESPSSSPTPQQLVADSIKDSNQVNAITVLTLLDKLVNMLDSVQENQQKMEKRQIDIENSVKGIQNDITKLSKSHTSTSNTVSKLLEKSRKVSANMREVKDRMDKQTVQVKKLEHNHTQLLRRNNFKVLIFQVSCTEIVQNTSCLLDYKIVYKLFFILFLIYITSTGWYPGRPLPSYYGDSGSWSIYHRT